MTLVANKPGYVDAMRRLRTQLGQDVIFVVAGSPTYPPGTKMDPETGKPIDAYVEATDDGYSQVTVRASVVNRPLIGDPNDQSRGTPIGPFAADFTALLIDVDDYPQVKNATEFQVYGVSFQITDKRPDGIGGLQRYIIFGQQT